MPAIQSLVLEMHQTHGKCCYVENRKEEQRIYYYITSQQSFVSVKKYFCCKYLLGYIVLYKKKISAITNLIFTSKSKIKLLLVLSFFYFTDPVVGILFQFFHIDVPNCNFFGFLKHIFVCYIFCIKAIILALKSLFYRR